MVDLEGEWDDPVSNSCSVYSAVFRRKTQTSGTTRRVSREAIYRKTRQKNYTPDYAAGTTPLIDK